MKPERPSPTLVTRLTLVDAGLKIADFVLSVLESRKFKRKPYIKETNADLKLICDLLYAPFLR